MIKKSLNLKVQSFVWETLNLWTYADSDCIYFEASRGLLPGELDGTEQQKDIVTFRLNKPRG